MKAPFHYDGIRKILRNPHIRMTELSFKEIGAAGFKGTATRPIPFITLALNYYFHQYDLTGYHVVNIVIHLINSILLYFFIKTTLDIIGNGIWNPRFIAFFAGLVWLVHPIQTQSVTYIVQRVNSLAALFYLLSLMCYVKGRLFQKKGSNDPQSEISSRSSAWSRMPAADENGKGGLGVVSPKGNPNPISRRQYIWFICSILAWILALGCKQTAVTLPFFIFLYEWYFFQDLSKNWLKSHLKYFFGFFIILGLIIFMYLGPDPFEKLLSLDAFANKEFTFTERLLTQPRVVIFYLSLLFFPHPSRLNLDYDFTLSHSLIDPLTTLISLCVIVGLVGFAFYTAKHQRLISFCILWYLGNLVIESSIIPLAIIFEHRVYLPSMLVCVMVVALLYRYIKYKWFIAGLLCVVVLVFSIWTYQRNHVWRDAVSLWSDNVKKSEKKAGPRLNLAIALGDQRNIDEAISQFSEALRINPEYARAHYNLGITLGLKGNLDNAIRHFSEAIRINPDYMEAHNALGRAYLHQGNLNEAIRHFSEAIRINPEHADGHNNMGVALSNQGDLKEAVKHFSEALRINPEYAVARHNLESALRRLNKSDRTSNNVEKP